MRTAWAMASLWVLAGCDSGGACTFNSECPAGEHCSDGTCISVCSDEVPCPAGQACTSFGMCVAIDVDAGVDAGTDAGRAIDGGTDAGSDAGTDAGADAGPPEEVCTPSTTDSTPLDEDGDGAIDEGCPWHFGVPHPVLAMHRSTTDAIYSPRLSADGLRLYFADHVADALPSGHHAVLVSERASTDAPFGAPELVAGLETVFAWGLALSTDELEAYLEVQVGATQEIHRATRASRSAPFGAPVRVDATDVAGHSENHPYLSADGLELLFEVRTVGLHRLRRASSAEPFTGTAEPLTITGETAPTTAGALSPDGRTLLFTRREPTLSDRLYLAERTAPGVATFAAPTPATAIQAGANDSVSIPFYSASTRELFFGSNRPWSPAGFATWRVEVCRDGPCATREIACPAPGVRSPDGLRCYTRGEEETTSWESARTACLARSTAATSSHLATLHSRAEHDVVWGLRTASRAVWIGMYDREGPGPSSGLPAIPECARAGAASVSCVFAWSTGEPWTYAPWGLCCGGAGDPSGVGEDCGVLWDGFSVPGDFGDYPCAGGTVPLTPYVCEDELWPTW